MGVKKRDRCEGRERREIEWQERERENGERGWWRWKEKERDRGLTERVKGIKLQGSAGEKEGAGVDEKRSEYRSVKTKKGGEGGGREERKEKEERKDTMPASPSLSFSISRHHHASHLFKKFS